VSHGRITAATLGNGCTQTWRYDAASGRLACRPTRPSDHDVFRLPLTPRPDLTGHVTEEMQRKYSTVGSDEKRSALAGALAVLRPHQLGGDPGVNSGVNAKAPTNLPHREPILVEDATSRRSHLQDEESSISGGKGVN
jgi:hypothetical protein